MKLALILSVCLLPALAQTPALDLINHNRPLLDAHNCYPYEGKWGDRIDRALSTGFPVAIEQDLAWANGKPVVSHTDKTKGDEPTLREYFFERVRPIVEKALADNDRAKWPIVVVHFDFKSNVEPLHRAVWALLGEYQGWITTATKGADDRVLAPFEPKPLLVLTEDNDAQEKVFFTELPAGAKLRLFGSAHTSALPANLSSAERNHLAATLPPEKLLSERPTNYRRWWNNSWFLVEEGGQHAAGDWTDADDRRLRALVDHAHRLGYWIRFYTLDGFAKPEDQGWGDGYNFGSHEAVAKRWRAALAAGVNLIASDQYEELRAAMGK
jgi:hypothetical protein